MSKYPPDIVVLDTDALVHVRLGRGRKNPRVLTVKTYRLPAGTFDDGMVTPDLLNEGAIAEALRRLKLESGKWDAVSILLPDSWFRMNLIEVPALPDNPTEALEVVRWSLKRTLPIPPEELRIATEVLGKTTTAVKVLVISAREKTLAAMERLFAAAGFDVVMIESLGLNIWNAVTIREPATAGDRLFLYLRRSDFTTAVFRGNQPLFLRSRNLNAERTLPQELRLSASYLRDTLRADGFEHCYVAGEVADEQTLAIAAREFNAPVQRVTASDYADDIPSDVEELDAVITASAGVFAA